ncbi:hypothetical protein ARZXY2_4536 (plasmid) [Arthrobacter sp. ZXY-2]|nr:hypothetical protein ARZXY2_4536 [Arthrobacter sp. ZXY-2]
MAVHGQKQLAIDTLLAGASCMTWKNNSIAPFVEVRIRSTTSDIRG